MVAARRQRKHPEDRRRHKQVRNLIIHLISKL